MRAALLAALLLPLAGCLGQDHVFPDESSQVATLHVNAYQKSGDDAKIEITGEGPGNATHAFRGHLTATLERQRNGTTTPEYSALKIWDLRIQPSEFSNAGAFPLYTLVIPRGEFPATGTYRIRVGGTIEDRAVQEQVALFDAEASQQRNVSSQA